LWQVNISKVHRYKDVNVSLDNLEFHQVNDSLERTQWNSCSIYATTYTNCYGHGLGLSILPTMKWQQVVTPRSDE